MILLVIPLVLVVLAAVFYLGSGENLKGQLTLSGTEKMRSVQTVAVQVPAAITDVTISADNLSLKWTAVSGATGYRVYSSDNTSSYGKVIADVKNATSFILPKFPYIQNYYLRVEAYNSAGISKISNVVVADRMPPTLVKNVMISTSSLQGSVTKIVNLSWDKSTDATSAVAGYNVYCGEKSKTETGGVYGSTAFAPPCDKGLMTASLVTGTSYKISNLKPEKSYYFAVTAKDTAGNETGYSNEVLLAASVYAAKNSQTDKIILPAGSSNQTASRSDSGNISSQVANRGSGAGGAAAASGSLGTYTNQNSAVVSDLQPPSNVGRLVATADQTGVTLTWSPATDDVGVKGYKVYYGTQSVVATGGNYQNGPLDVGMTSSLYAPSYKVTGLAANVPYYFAVTAYDAAGNQSQNFSTEASATFLK